MPKFVQVGLISLVAMSLVSLAVIAQVGTAGPQPTLVEEVRRATAWWTPSVPRR